MIFISLFFELEATISTHLTRLFWAFPQFYGKPDINFIHLFREKQQQIEASSLNINPLHQNFWFLILIIIRHLTNLCSGAKYGKWPYVIISEVSRLETLREHNDPQSITLKYLSRYLLFNVH